MNTVIEILKMKERTKRWLAKQIGVSESLVGKWQVGDRTMSAKHKRAIAEVLEIPGYLLFKDTHSDITPIGKELV